MLWESAVLSLPSGERTPQFDDPLSADFVMTVDSSSSSTGRAKALLLHGGWAGHRPEQFSDFAAKLLLQDFEIVRSESLEILNDASLAEFDLLIPVWTFGELSADQEHALLRAVERGMGLVAWHGAASAFLSSRAHKFMLGGQFVAHPGGSEMQYEIHFLGNDPLTDGLPDLSVTTEQYYLLVDPAVKVLATTSIQGGEMNWVKGIEMPVAWIRRWGRGRVFYCSLGHSPEILEQSTLLTLLRRAVWWASSRDA